MAPLGQWLTYKRIERAVVDSFGLPTMTYAVGKSLPWLVALCFLRTKPTSNRISPMKLIYATARLRTPFPRHMRLKT